MLEKTVNQKIEDTYSSLKDAAFKQGCKVVFEKPNSKIVFRQGSLWGVAPKTAKKTINATFSQEGSNTKIALVSKLASDWLNVTSVGCVLAAALAGVCFWMASDLTAFLANRTTSFWSGLVTLEGSVNSQAARALVNLGWSLTAFLLVVIVLEAVILVYAKAKIDVFAKETLRKMS